MPEPDPLRDDAAWTGFCADFRAWLLTDGNRCVQLGADERLGELPRGDAAAVDARVAGARGLLRRLDDPDGLGARDAGDAAALDRDLARLTLQAQVHADTLLSDGLPRHARLPSVGEDVGAGVFLQFVDDPRPEEERLTTITARLEEVPHHAKAVLGRLERPVSRWVDMDAEKCTGLPDLFGTILDRAREIGWFGVPRLERAVELATAALLDYGRRLEALPASDGFHLDEADARRLVALRGIDRSLEDLHELARDFLAETAATVEELRGRLVAKHGLPADTSADELTRVLAERFAVPLPDGRLEGVLDRYERERERILAFVTARDLFPVPDDQDLVVMRTPHFMEPSIPAGAMMPPPPLREGVRRSLVYLTLSQELLAEHTELSVPVMMIHEGIPGHHLQLAWAASNPSFVRRVYDGLHLAEGWTTMLEDYMLEAGYLREAGEAGDLTDEARFVGKRDISRIGARVAIDLFFMTGERSFLDVGVPCDLSSPDPFVAAGNLLAAVTGFVPERVQAELNWYSQERGYPLSYLVGNRLTWELKADVAASSGLTGLDLDRAFHRTFLAAGNMPLSFLRRVFRDEGLLD